MIDLYNKATDELIGSITEAELKLLVDRLEETSLEDQDYYIDRATIDLLADGTATDHLLQLLRTGLGPEDGIDIRWEKRGAK
jgi:hypothetical protein